MHKKDIHLVLIHGFVFNKTIWNLLDEQLAKMYTVHLIDLPGYGEQKEVQAHSLADMAQHILNQLACAEKKFIWVGWSLGGAIARTLAQLAPDTTQGVITLAANPHFIAREDWPCAIKADAFENLKKLFINKPEKALARFLMLQGSLNITRPSETFKPYYQPLAPEVLLRDLNLLENSDLRKLSGQLTVPQLNIFGSHDHLVPVTVIDQLKHLSPKAQNVTIKDAGHALLLSHVTECLTAMDQFINESIITQ